MSSSSSLSVSLMNTSAPDAVANSVRTPSSMLMLFGLPSNTRNYHWLYGESMLNLFSIFYVFSCLDVLSQLRSTCLDIHRQCVKMTHQQDYVTACLGKPLKNLSVSLSYFTFMTRVELAFEFVLQNAAMTNFFTQLSNLQNR